MIVRKGWDEVRGRMKYIVKEIDPVTMLPFLMQGDEPLLTEQDRDLITTASLRDGNIQATQSQLITRLQKRGPNGFCMFVAALREVGFGHAAQLFDPEFKVTAIIPNGMRDDGVYEQGVAADIRIKICLTNATDEQVRELETFCERFRISYKDETVELRKHFDDLLSKNFQERVHLVKTTYTDETPLIFVVRLSNIDAAETFWGDYRNGVLVSTVKEKLGSFADENNCFKRGNINYDVVVDPDNYKKVYDTLRNQEERKVLVDGMEKLKLELREYQQELVQPALQGKNTIICSPTGSGKTFVAMEVVKEHAMCPEPKSIAFIVNTVSLVEQQLSCLQQYLPESVEVTSLCGSSPDISLPSVLRDYTVVVLTAQVLLNALKKKKAASSGGENDKHVSISQFSLLVFDECHHTTKDHPYNEIMRWYMREKYQVPGASLPQIMGLSASLGIGAGNAEHHVMGLCANLDAQELQVYTEPHITYTKITPIARDRNNSFCTTISDVMCKIEELMSSCGSGLPRPSHPHGSQPYENWVVNLGKEDLGRDVLTCAEQLKFYNNSLMINDEVRAVDALEYLQENIKSNQSTEVEIKLHQIFNDAVDVLLADVDRCEANPGLQKLEERLQQKFSNHDGETPSKGIIFVKTRLVASALVKWLESSETLKNVVKNPTLVIGCGQRNEKAGMTKARQDQEIKNFREGDCNVVVATSTLLEGIDIQKCNFAINYGMRGNEITMVQARGRVRAGGDEADGAGVYDIIVPHGQVALRERDLSRERLMKASVEKVKKMGKEEFTEKVQRLQKTAYEEYMKRLEKSSRKVQSIPEDVAFHCLRCGVFACKARDIKKSHTAYIVPNYEEKLHNVKFVDAESSKYMPGDFSRTAKTYCSKCGHDWGNRARNGFGEFPLIKIIAFRVKHGETGRMDVYKKWSDFPYELDEFDPENDCGTHSEAHQAVHG